MHRDKFPLEGDYVYYKGDMNIFPGSLHSFEIGRIDKLQAKKRIHLYLLDKKQHIECDLDKIYPVFTSKNLLESIGFSESENNNRKRYSLNGIYISEYGIFYKKHIPSDFCAADFTNGISNLDIYISDGEFDRTKFHTDYPHLHYVNELFQYLKNNGIEVDIEKVLSEEYRRRDKFNI